MLNLTLLNSFSFTHQREKATINMNRRRNQLGGKAYNERLKATQVRLRYL